ncbi:MAG: MSHA biogenesis protein MshK [Gammaproteobacteria bacterium]|nr:MSHA biogenesis protein MshK [Gammaproteobacteria bacterium]
MFSTLGLFSLLLLLPVGSMALEDPTRPPDYQPLAEVAANPDKSTVQWSLSSILIASGRRLAVINGQLLALGDTIDEARVVSIEKGLVTLYVGDERVKLRLVPANKKPPSNGIGGEP